MWGADAGVWNPERFLRPDKAGTTSVGMFANLLNFCTCSPASPYPNCCKLTLAPVAAGIRACIGWRFAVIEMQAIAATLIENFEFALPPQTKENIIRRKPTDVMAPMADGHLGVWMGLKVKYCGSS